MIAKGSKYTKDQFNDNFKDFKNFYIIIKKVKESLTPNKHYTSYENGLVLIYFCVLVKTEVVK